MGYNKFKYAEKTKPEQNPLWRGVGCILMVVLPLVTFGLTLPLTPVLAATGLVPYYLLGHATFTPWTYGAPVLGNIVIYLGSINDLWLGLIVFFVIIVLLSGIASLLYVTVLQVIGPPRYTEKDAPPSTHKAKKYTR